MLSQAYTQINSHAADLIEPVMAILDATSARRLSENSRIQFVSVEARTGTRKKRATVKEVLHELLAGREIIPAQQGRGSISVLHSHEDFNVYSTLDVCIKVCRKDDPPHVVFASATN